MRFEEALRKAGNILYLDRQGTLNYFNIRLEQADALSGDPGWKWVIVRDYDEGWLRTRMIGRKKRGWKRSEIGVRDNQVLRLEDL